MYEPLEETLGIHFENPSLLQQALTHRSYIYETAGEGLSSNERLEFLGDSILAFISADYLYRAFPDLSEGELSDLRAALVRRETLATFAQEINLGNFLLMGKGEQSSGVSQRVLASAFEAVLGAMYLRSGNKSSAAISDASIRAVSTEHREQAIVQRSKVFVSRTGAGTGWHHTDHIVL